MADNRTLAKGAIIGGAPVYYTEESTTDTTMPNTSYFKTEDVDGKPVKISRDNIMGIVKDCLGTILNSGSDQTTVTKVPTLNGNTLGASAVSTLASVLGANYDYKTFSGDCNTLLQSGCYYIEEASNAANDIGILEVSVTRQTNTKRAFIIQRQSWSSSDDPGLKVYERVLYLNSVGNIDLSTGWSRVDNFGCNTPAALASLLGGYLINKDGIDVNTLTRPGIYDCDGACTNIPQEGYSFNIQVYKRADRIFQVAYKTYGSAAIYIRLYDGTTWEPWKIVKTESLT